MANDPGDGPDDWLSRWLPLLEASVADAAGAPVLELGCGWWRASATSLRLAACWCAG